MMDYARSDLACESMGSGCDGKIEGTSFSRELCGMNCVLRTEILTEEAAGRIGRGVGTYVTVECGRIDRLSEGERGELAKLLAREIRSLGERLSGKRIKADFEVLVAGLGNESLTADAIGPKTVRGVTATRHLREQEHEVYQGLGCASLSAVMPGVLGDTGIETLELLRGAVESVRPDLVLAVDALAARSCSRLASTVQLSSEGIRPGSGVGNRRSAIDRESLGVPVIAIGVPTVVNSATLVYDALHRAGIGDTSPALKRVLSEGESFFVSPRECDLIAQSVGKLLSSAINEAFGISFGDG